MFVTNSRFWRMLIVVLSGTLRENDVNVSETRDPAYPCEYEREINGNIFCHHVSSKVMKRSYSGVNQWLTFFATFCAMHLRRIYTRVSFIFPCMNVFSGWCACRGSKRFIEFVFVRGRAPAESCQNCILKHFFHWFKSRNWMVSACPLHCGSNWKLVCNGAS